MPSHAMSLRRRKPRLGLLLCTAALCVAHSRLPAAETSAVSMPVVGMDMHALRATGVSAVFWTRRSDYYTLQIVFERPLNGRGLPMGPGRAPPLPPEVSAWLMKSQGRHIEPLSRRFVPASDSRQPSEVLYRFPLSAGIESTAVAIRVGKEFVIQPLPDLGVATTRQVSR